MTAMVTAFAVLVATAAYAAPIAKPAAPESNVIAVKQDCSAYKKQTPTCKNVRWDSRAKACVCK